MIAENKKSPRFDIKGIAKEITKIQTQLFPWKSNTPGIKGTFKWLQTAANPKLIAKENITQPKKPSQDFLGEILGFILCFPNKTPTKYAPISVEKAPNIA